MKNSINFLAEKNFTLGKSIVMATHGLGTTVDHPTYGNGVIVEVNLGTYTVWFKRRGDVEISQLDERLEILETQENETGGIELDEVVQVLTDVLEKWADITHIVPLGDKWKGGKMILEPGKEGLQSKEIPIDIFFHKIVMLRDRIRVMEQKINSNKLLDDETKVDIQQYLSRMYGSLTTFNVLFDDKEDFFRGQGKS